jgi:nitrite reductase/ring-hydroxylating ferredoxin subunit
MKRGDFLKEMGNSLFQTIKPFINEDLEKFEEAADRALGITWLPFMKETEIYPELEMKFIAGKPIIVTRNGANMQAMDGVCPVCSNIIILTALYSSGKCLNCQKEFNFKTQSGELHLESLPTKRKDGMHFIGIQRDKKQGEYHA